MPAKKSQFERFGNAVGPLLGFALALWIGWAVYQWISSGGVILLRFP